MKDKYNAVKVLECIALGASLLNQFGTSSFQLKIEQKCYLILIMFLTSDQAFKHTTVCGKL